MIQERLSEQLSFQQFSYFPTLIYRFDVPDAGALNELLLSRIYAAREADALGVEKSNYRTLGGWHSKEDLQKRPGFEGIVRHVDAATSLISKDVGYASTHVIRIGSMWSIINGPGAVNLAHVHPGCMWSGVYYVQAPENCGKISFVDPRTVQIMRRPVYAPDRRLPRKCWTKATFAPVPGRMLIFPSWLYHAVEPNMADKDKGNADRVIISFNLSQAKVQHGGPA